MTEFPDTNGDGIPDAFENRLPISEILNSNGGLDALSVAGPNRHTAEVEIGAPRAYRMFTISNGGLLLEVGESGNKCEVLIFDTRQALLEFMDDLRNAGAKAFPRQL